MHVQNFLPKLKEHVLPRVKALILQESDSPAEDIPVTGAIPLPVPDVPDHIGCFFSTIAYFCTTSFV
jgi:hypothetical protein